MRFVVASMLLLVCSIPPASAANDCNCGTIVSGCSATISLDKQRGIAALFASAAVCARVVFDIDNTPYTSVFSGGNSIENVTIFDKSKRVSATVRSCDVCQSAGTGGRADDSSGTPSSDISGRWVVSNDTGSVTWTFNDNNGSVSASASGSSRGQASNYSCSGSRSADKLFLSCTYAVGQFTNSANMVFSIHGQTMTRDNSPIPVTLYKQ